MGEDLTSESTHFAFGKNWASFAQLVGEAEIVEAERGLRQLLGDSLKGKTFLDIGCGSGLHSLAALRMGASEVVAIDIDADSAATARAVLQLHAPSYKWNVLHQSVFDRLPSVGTGLDPDLTEFDVVYAWGVLHHTGDLYRALRATAERVGPSGLFVFALYRRVWLDAFWGLEKRWYAHASPMAQARVRSIYRLLYAAGLAATGRSFREYVSGYRSKRGMSFEHDVHDWLGGWPYESIGREQVDWLMQERGLVKLKVQPLQGPRFFGRDLGLLGSWCDEYVYRRE